MPQENRKRGRGRRGQEKDKKDTVLDELHARVEDGARPTKRPRLSAPASGANDIPLDQDEGDYGADYSNSNDKNALQAYGAGEEDGRQDDRPEAQFFGMLDESETAYLKRADLMLENDSFATAEDRAMFLDSVWNEASGKELKIACSQSCSRVLERLIRGSTSTQLKAAWGRMKGNFLGLVQHRFASHCVEALFMAAVPIASAELLVDDKKQEEAKENEYEDEEALALKKPIEEFYLETIQELQDNLGYLITEQFASHTLRVLLVVLSGKPLAGSKSILQSKKKEKVYSGGKQDSAMLEERVVPASFKKAADDLLRDSIAGLDTNYLRALATNQLANPVLQLFLELEFAASGKGKAKDEKSLFRRLLPDESPAEGTQSAAFIKGLLYDPVGSRLLETIIEHAPGKAFKSIYKALFKENLGNIVKNDVAGFVVTKILNRLSQEELESAAQQIIPQISLLFERARHSIVKCLIERCRVRGVKSQPIAAAIGEAYGEQGQKMLEKFLQPSSEAQEGISADRKAQIEQTNSVKMHASLLAQTMLTKSDAHQQLLADSLVECDGQFLVRLAKDRTATHVLQAALKPETIDKAVRRQLIQKLNPFVKDLSLDTVGSHVVDALNGAATGAHFLRERIAEELSRHQNEMKDSYSGRQVWRNWQLDLYLRQPRDWTAKAKEQFEGQSIAAPAPQPLQQQTRPKYKGRNAKQGGEEAPKLTGIEAARARFAAKKRQEGANKFGTGANRTTVKL